MHRLHITLILGLVLLTRAGAIGAVIVDEPLPACNERASEQKKLLLVVAAPSKSKSESAQAFWSAPLFERLTRDVLIARVSDAPTIKQLADAGIRVPPAPRGALFRQGKLVRSFGDSVDALGRPAPGSGAITSDLGELLRLHWTIADQEKRDHRWFEGRGVTAVPQPAPVFSLGDDTLGPGVSEVANEHPLALLHRARSAASAHDALAPALYCLLWEKHRADDPALAPALTIALAREMHALSVVNPRAKARFTRLLREQGNTVAPALPSTVFAWVMLSRTIDAHEPHLRFLDDALNAPDAALMMPALERRYWNEALPRLHFGDATAGVKDPALVPAAMLKQIARPVQGLSVSDAQDLARLRQGLLRLECCRRYADLLRAGRSEPARAVAEVLLRSENPSLNKRALAASAIIAGVSDPASIRWLDETSDANGRDDRGVPAPSLPLRPFVVSTTPTSPPSP